MMIFCAMFCSAADPERLRQLEVAVLDD